MSLAKQASVMLLLFCASLGVCAESLMVDLPVRCDLDKRCFVQNYVDHDPGFAYQDFAVKPIAGNSYPH